MSVWSNWPFTNKNNPFKGLKKKNNKFNNNKIKKSKIIINENSYTKIKGDGNKVVDNNTIIDQSTINNNGVRTRRNYIKVNGIVIKDETIINGVVYDNTKKDKDN